MRNVKQTISALCTALTVSGCSSGSSPEVQLAKNLESALLMDARVYRKFNTAFDGMPITGSADYHGYVVVTVDTDVKDSILAGRVNLTADFEFSEIAGSMHSFVGKNQTTTADSYTGELAVTGDIGVIDPNDMFLDYAGTLQGNGDVLIFDSYAYGRFQGTPIIGLHAYDYWTVDVNGVATDMEMTIIAEP